MSAYASTTPSLSPRASAGRSLFSRLTSPLRTRTRNLTDFHIRPDEPHRQYSPGDLVKGAVVLTVVKPIRITHLTVCLHGFVRVFKHPNGGNDLPPVDAGLTASSNPRKTQYFGNGHASLFQDELTLCGEGRLEPGVYEFNFELDFPSKSLPTSIDFERGTISYKITSTITRPTSIAATSSCDQKLVLVDTVDIGPMQPPKPRTISLEPISRRSRRKRSAKLKENGSLDTTDAGSSSEPARLAGSPLPDDSASQHGDNDQQTNLRNRTPPDMRSNASVVTSADSTVSSSTGMSFRIAAVPSSARSGRDSQNTGSKVSLADKTITATIELLRAGVLPGDNLPLRISIKHTKAIKSMHGIIITLYRQGRIDSAPPLSLFEDIKGKEAARLKHEEYYPKSKTGLGGLSLTSAGSSSLFRKDLAQTFAPILVDPVSLTAVVNASVRVPEDAFPTISGVPGQMISFKYHVEVVVDLGGKLAGQQRHIPRVGSVTLPSSYATPGNRGDTNPNMLAAWGGSIVDTDHIRREKSVVECHFDITVGTVDSARKRGRGNSSAAKTPPKWTEEVPATSAAAYEPIFEESMAANGQEHFGDYEGQPYQPYPYYEDQYHGYHENGPEHHQHYYHEHYEEYPPPTHTEIPVPPPEVYEDGLTDKERARRAEQRLLPSQPPPEIGEPSSSRTVIPPTAPSVLIEEPEDDIYGNGDATPQAALRIVRTLSHVPSVEGTPTPIGPSAPPLGDVNSATEAESTDDKQELERRRLFAEASAPSEFAADDDDNGGEGSSRRPQHEASAPVLVEENGYGGHYTHHDLPGPSAYHESLPKYER